MAWVTRFVSNERLADRILASIVFLLPLSTVFVRAGVAWKPWLVLLIVLTVVEVASGAARRTWNRSVLRATGGFLLAAGLTLRGGAAFLPGVRLLAAMAIGACLMFAVGRRGEDGVALVLRVVPWSAASMAVTGVVLSFATAGTFGAAAVDTVSNWPLVFRINKPAYLDSGFISLTNWHQDPGYSAAWSALWLAIVLVSVSARRLDWRVAGLIGGGLVASATYAFSRTGWITTLFALAVPVLWPGRQWRWRTVAASGLAAVVGAGLIAAVYVADVPRIGNDAELAFTYRLQNFLDLGSLDPEAIVDLERLEAQVDDNRVAVWRVYLDQFVQSPLRGIGLGRGWVTAGLQEPHNLGVEVVGEMGVLGISGIAWLAFALARSGRGRVGAIALAVALLPGATQTVIFEPTLWLAAGLWLAGGRPSAGRAHPAPPGLGTSDE
jgi:hypothetical protein